MRKKLLFLTLNTFSATGGIEKVCRAAAKALYEIAEESDHEADLFSMYDVDNSADTRYIPADRFKGFGGSRIKFVAEAVRTGIKADVVILSHVNLLLPGYLIKLLSPKTKLLLIAHGIEVWESFGGRNKKMLNTVDLFLPVSHYTGEKMKSIHGIAKEKIHVLNNCLDPFLEEKHDIQKEQALKEKYGFKKNDFVLLTLTRLKHAEQYKGYDRVVEALASLKNVHPDIKYLIAGKYDEDEKARLDKIIHAHGMNDKVVFAGFVNEAELAPHFNIADAYVMPSTGEGFGIVFIEALFYGKPVIAGNADGSVDALGEGEFGLLLDPSDVKAIANAIQQIFLDKEKYIPQHHSVLERFGYPAYLQKLKKILFKDRITNGKLLVS